MKWFPHRCATSPASHSGKKDASFYGASAAMTSVWRGTAKEQAKAHLARRLKQLGYNQEAIQEELVRHRISFEDL